MTRREFPSKVRVAAFERAQGRCEECTALLLPGKYQYDHRIPDALGGEPTLDNCVVTCTTCHGRKTATVDVPNIARAKRREARHIGAKTPSRRSFATNKNGPFKKKLDGNVERRNK